MNLVFIWALTFILSVCLREIVLNSNGLSEAFDSIINTCPKTILVEIASTIIITGGINMFKNLRSSSAKPNQSTEKNNSRDETKGLSEWVD